MTTFHKFMAQWSAIIQRGQVPPERGSNMPTNEDRAGWALAAVQTFADKTGLDISPDADGLETTVTDLLADLMHLCQQEGIDFDGCLSLATDHYGEEAI